MKQRAAAYIRVSTADQTEFSPDAQLKQIKEYASKNSMFLAEANIYADEGISGRSTGKRVAFNNMIKNAKMKPRPFDVILVHKFNRFARNREDAIIFKSLLKRDCGIKVISITEPIEDDKIGIIIESVLDAFSEYYSVNLSEEVKKG
ncbi:MAG: recombinase family protein, partial [Vallitaleaceae bacterium]|nr:recombinase family protein [Vallitaleaceae bacterium]